MKSKLPKCGFRPLSNYVVVQLDEMPKMSDGGIAIPDVAIKPATEGVVVAAGAGMRRKNGAFVPISVRVGDRVTITGHAQIPIENDGERFVLMREPEILVVHEVEA